MTVTDLCECAQPCLMQTLSSKRHVYDRCLYHALYLCFVGCIRLFFLMITPTNQLPSRHIIGVTCRNTKFQLDTGFNAQEIGTTIPPTIVGLSNSPGMQMET